MIGRTNAFSGGGTVRLDAPTGLDITGTTLSWNPVSNADNYEIYANTTTFIANYRVGIGAPDSSLGDDGDYYFNTFNGDFYNKISGVWDKIDSGLSTSKMNFNLLLEISSVGSYAIQIIATGIGYVDSIRSESIYFNYGQLQTPTGLRRSNNYLVWNSVSYATQYVIMCENPTQSWTITAQAGATQQKEMASILTSSGTYYLKVKAQGIGYVDSNYSQVYAWEGGTSTFTVTFRRADPSSDLYVSITPSGGSTTRLGYDDSISYTLSESTTFTIEYEASGYSTPTKAYYDGTLVGGPTTTSLIITRTVSSGSTIDIQYYYE